MRQLYQCLKPVLSTTILMSVYFGSKALHSDPMKVLRAQCVETYKITQQGNPFPVDFEKREIFGKFFCADRMLGFFAPLEREPMVAHAAFVTSCVNDKTGTIAECHAKFVPHQYKYFEEFERKEPINHPAFDFSPHVIEETEERETAIKI